MYTRYFKRAFDILLSLMVLALLSGLLIGIALVYVVTMQFPMFFKQVRTGKKESPFTIYKFRTLKNQAGGGRTFWLGDILRFLSLDELPQLWNVLKGDMSLIGPRPLPVEYLPLYSLEQRKRHNIKPGLTGWAQVNGRNSITWHEKFNLDLYYVNNVSFKLDLLIVLKTIALLLSFRKDVSLQEEKFSGN